MFYSDDQVLVLVLVMLSGVALLVLGKPGSHSANSVFNTLSPPCRAGLSH